MYSFTFYSPSSPSVHKKRPSHLYDLLMIITITVIIYTNITPSSIIIIPSTIQSSLSLRPSRDPKGCSYASIDQTPSISHQKALSSSKTSSSLRLWDIKIFKLCFTLNKLVSIRYYYSKLAFFGWLSVDCRFNIINNNYMILKIINENRCM